ncbi:prepilin-type N-terminal cleavage/methylation domain-containing protein [Fortiea sp. LEGE XX443]|uniref:hormogonium polysaccharide secretion pseudopilin HpsC n=1 Tax=Fortiea sp. LEGE XX443 TaxID=1828611 RepID=UPI00187FC124|nr:hormogonium polysaccharide secretion pseudopilin HpsC [Fortiea sp. LEGE XX443]MBE9004026.1 prepilin-type N-terminal cleavage/methylation domain-containing protein [Fortiea sp. LEGE XX443]
MSSLKFILITQLKHSKNNDQSNGFTLIELLIAMVIAALVITPLMLFMMGVLDGDRKEQAKTTTEQEMQAAIDYIARDLQQAVYIYDAHGVTRNRNTTDVTLSGIQDQIPPVKTAPNCTSATVCTPVLVFWKREFLAGSVGVTSPTDTTRDDGYAYSLVAYYLITNTNGSNTTWSKQARIGRFQIRGQVNAANTNTTNNTGFSPPPLDPNITGSTLKERMNQWRTSLTSSQNYSSRVETLVDYISTTSPAITTNTAGVCPGTNASPKLVGSLTTGFYTCVDAAEVLAQVFIRGNALARIQNNNLTYQNSQKSYFPSASVRVQGRGFLFTK